MFRIEIKGGEKVEKGNYWNVANGERVHFENAGTLPGDSSASYLKFHPAALIVVGPLLGLAYAIFLPFAAIAMVTWVVLQKAFGGLANAVWKAAVFSWQPSEAYLTGRKTKKDKKQDEKATEKSGGDSNKEPQ